MRFFNLDEYLQNPSQKVVTRDGREVRIICTDAKGDEPIIALVYNNIREEENVYTYNRDGYFYGDNDSCLDLFFALVKREGWVNLFKDEELPFINGDIYKSEKEAKEEAEGEPDYITSIKIEWEE